MYTYMYTHTHIHTHTSDHTIVRIILTYMYLALQMSALLHTTWDVSLCNYLVCTSEHDIVSVNVILTYLYLALQMSALLHTTWDVSCVISLHLLSLRWSSFLTWCKLACVRTRWALSRYVYIYSIYIVYIYI